MCRLYVRVSNVPFEIAKSVMTKNGVLVQNNSHAVTPGSYFWRGVEDFDVKGIGMVSDAKNMIFRTVKETVDFLNRFPHLTTRSLAIHKRLYSSSFKKQIVEDEIQPFTSRRAGLTFMHVGTTFFTPKANASPAGEPCKTDSQYIFISLLRALMGKPITMQTVLSCLGDVLSSIKERLLMPSVMNVVVISKDFAIAALCAHEKEPIPMYFKRGVDGYEISTEPTDDNLSQWQLIPNGHVLVIEKARRHFVKPFM